MRNDVTTGAEARSPYVRNTAPAVASRTLTIDGAGFGATRGTGQVTLNGNPLPASAYLSWTGRQIQNSDSRRVHRPGRISC